MRFAISMATAVCGLVLLGLGIYGQPAVYLRQVQDQWDALMDHPAIEPPAGQSQEAEAERVARLQHEVARLENKLTAQQPPALSEASAGQPDMPASKSEVTPAAPGKPPELAVTRRPATAPSAPFPSTAETPAVATKAPPVSAPPGSASPATASPAAAVPTGAPTPAMSPDGLSPEMAAILAEALRSAAGQTAPGDAQPVPADPRAAAPPALPSPSPIVADRREPGAQPVASKSASTKSEPPATEPARPAPPKLASPKPVPAPPMPPQPAPSRQDGEDTQSVLARLRQTGPGSAPAQQANAAPAPESRPRPAALPTLPKLTAARAALANGRVEDARRLLQEAQLQLVFRPVDAAGDDPALAGKRAADVARALEALSANDLPLSRRYIDSAAGEASVTATNPPVQPFDQRLSGYAPAYPSR